VTPPAAIVGYSALPKFTESREISRIANRRSRSRGIAKARALAEPAGFVERRRIKRACYRFQHGDIDLLAHACFLLWPVKTPAEKARASGYLARCQLTIEEGHSWPS
jgi:hypothetical protein